MSEKRKFESGAKKRAKKKSQLLVAARECRTQTKLLFTSNSETIKNIPVMKSVINEIDEINTINNTITELNTNNNEKTELNVKTKLDILDHPITVAARECQTQTKLILSPNSDIIKNIPAMKSVINEIDEINTINNTITESNTINNEITELNMKTKFDILDHPITVMSSDKARYPKITNGLLQSLVKYGACQPFEKDMTNNTFPVDPKTKHHLIIL